jgi:hypothetical protein
MARLELVLGAGETAKPGMQLTHSGGCILHQRTQQIMARLELVLGAGEAAKPGMQLTHSGDDWTRCT